jgi:serine/threonine protein phosphatase PrpC
MDREAADPLSLVEWSVAARAMPGEEVSGDRHLVKATASGMLLAVVDGLGHGPEAGEAAEAAVNALAACTSESVMAMLQICHDSIRHTRGVVIGLARFGASDATMTWLGVGDVDGVLLRARAGPGKGKEYLLLRGGVVGYGLPPLHPVSHPVERGDVLILATDGIRGGFADQVNVAEPARQIADRILAQHCKGTDDALVLAARYLGG